jgi:hypothetical protein
MAALWTAVNADARVLRHRCEYALVGRSNQQLDPFKNGSATR